MICDLRHVRPRIERDVAARARPGDDAELLVAFLSELLFVGSVERLLWRDVAVSFPAPGRVAAHGRGDVLSDRHPVEREVKAVTYHQACVRRDRGKYRGQVILDI